MCMLLMLLVGTAFACTAPETVNTCPAAECEQGSNSKEPLRLGNREKVAAVHWRASFDAGCRRWLPKTNKAAAVTEQAAWPATWCEKHLAQHGPKPRTSFTPTCCPQHLRVKQKNPVNREQRIGEPSASELQAHFCNNVVKASAPSSAQVRVAPVFGNFRVQRVWGPRTRCLSIVNTNHVEL